MTPDVFLRTAVVPALRFLPAQMDTVEARALILSIALQESRLQHRRQIGGPARSYTQFERAGIAGVLQHHASSLKAIVLCEQLDISPNVDAVYAAIEYQDLLCAGFSRLLLWTSRLALAGPNDPSLAWNLYVATWRPGRPHRNTWNGLYATAWDTVMQGRPLPSEERA